jgi:hypothetical protein
VLDRNVAPVREMYDERLEWFCLPDIAELIGRHIEIVAPDRILGHDRPGRESIGGRRLPSPSPSLRGRGSYGDELAALEKMDSVLGVLTLERETASGDDAEREVIEQKIAERAEARKNKDFAASDRIRDELLAMGIAIKDGPDGTTWSRIVQ